MYPEIPNRIWYFRTGTTPVGFLFFSWMGIVDENKIQNRNSTVKSRAVDKILCVILSDIKDIVAKEVCKKKVAWQRVTSPIYTIKIKNKYKSWPKITSRFKSLIIFLINFLSCYIEFAQCLPAGLLKSFFY